MYIFFFANVQIRGAPERFLPSACFSPIRTDREKHLSHSGSPQIPKESEGTAVPPISKKWEGKARCFFLCPAGAEEKVSKWEETLFCRRKSQAIFDGRGRVPRKFIEFSGDNEKKDRSIINFIEDLSFLESERTAVPSDSFGI